MKTTYNLYNGISDYLQQEGQRAGLRADKPYNVYLMIKALEEAGTAGSVFNGEQPLIELITTDDGDIIKEVKTVRQYLRHEKNFIQQETVLTRTEVNNLARQSGIVENPSTLEEAQANVIAIRTIINTMLALN